LERQAGPAARQMREKFLEQMKKVELQATRDYLEAEAEGVWRANAR
jgi:hypothetical protein